MRSVSLGNLSTLCEICITNPRPQLPPLMVKLARFQFGAVLSKATHKPNLFNLCIEVLIRSLDLDSVKVLAFADDLALVAENPCVLQKALDAVVSHASLMGLHFNPTKCASLVITKGKINAEPMLVKGTPISSLDDEGTYTYLGIQLGVHSRTKVSGILSQGVRDAEIICSSQLAPWQKINALKTFIYPRYSFFIRNGDPLLSDLKAFDNSMSAMIKELIHCPNKGTSRHYLYGDARKGGLGVPSLVDEYHVSSVACLTRLLFSKDKTVAEYFNGEFSRLVSKWMKTMRMQHPDATPVDRVDFLNCSERFDGRLASTESHSLWTRMRRSTRHLRKFLGTFEFLLLENDVLGLRVDRSPRVIDLSKSNASQLLRRLVNHRHIQTMVTEMKSQGKVLAAVSRSDHSTKFLRDGLYVSFSTYKWIHRARLNLHLLNGSNFKGLTKVADVVASVKHSHTFSNTANRL
ncbi:hypothetical protein L596_025957 [Steinernema carpocapsae]|uniref:Reverse transcriptase domain-containing protein n=1 Tax=Steinernema carpocapsae TaxID=34508 RepID=A0A4U5M9D9_STECR|nr:hypothetical protein L596_025957 [Steinernema carpocapsae]